VQLRRTLSKRGALLPQRARTLIDRMADLVDLARCDVLCIGPRNANELAYIQSKGARSIVGIDLYSDDQSILVMDMHDMTFPDDSFDVIYASHSLEHAYDVQRVVEEMIRVARTDAVVVIEVPVEYDTRGADLVDFKDLETLHQAFGSHVAQVLWSYRDPSESAMNDSGTTIIRTIFRVAK
jgi:SAM-dependent methyltransferase